MSIREKRAREIKAISGWVLVSEDDDAGWYICWHEVFGRKKDAIGFAVTNNWPLPYRAIRGSLSVLP